MSDLSNVWFHISNSYEIDWKKKLLQLHKNQGYEILRTLNIQYFVQKILEYLIY